MDNKRERSPSWSERILHQAKALHQPLRKPSIYSNPSLLSRLAIIFLSRAPNRA